MGDVQTNALYYGANVDTLRRYVPDATVGPYLPRTTDLTYVG